MDHRIGIGRAAEDLCAKRLSRRGWLVLSRNWRIKAGELDIVALDGAALVILEVKSQRAGSTLGPTAPVLAVGPSKQRRIRRLASAWIAANAHRVRFDEIRFDVVGITFDRQGGLLEYEHLEDAF
jgi:putative endonuclease